MRNNNNDNNNKNNNNNDNDNKRIVEKEKKEPSNFLFCLRQLKGEKFTLKNSFKFFLPIK